MPFTPTAMNYATEYGRALAQMFPYVLYFGSLYATPNNGRFRWVNSKTIEVPTMKVGGRRDSDRDTIPAKSRRYNVSWTPLTLENERYFDTLVHPRDIDQTNLVASIQNITTTFNNEQKFPEMDAYTISKLFADWVALGKSAITTAITSSNVLEIFDRMMEAQTEARVPAGGRILYVTPAVDTLLKNAAGISRTIDVKNLSPVIQRAIANLDSVDIQVVPSDMMKTAYDFTDGWEIGATAQQIKMSLIYPQSVITPVSYEFAQLDPPSAGSAGKWDYYEESHEDVFVLPNKEDGISFAVGA